MSIISFWSIWREGILIVYLRMYYSSLQLHDYILVVWWLRSPPLYQGWLKKTSSYFTHFFQQTSDSNIPEPVCHIYLKLSEIRTHMHLVQICKSFKRTRHTYSEINFISFRGCPKKTVDKSFLAQNKHNPWKCHIIVSYCIIIDHNEINAFIRNSNDHIVVS